MPLVKFLSVHDPFPTREKAVVEVLGSSGLRIETLSSLKVGDVNFDYPDVASITV